MLLNSYSYSFVYLILFLFLFLCSFKIAVNNEISIKILNRQKDYFAFFILLAFMSLRGFVACDYSEYYPAYTFYPRFQDGISDVINFLKNNLIALKWEKGFVFFAIILKSIKPDYFFYQGVIQSIFLIVIFKVFREEKLQNIILAFCFFFTFKGIAISFNLHRNCLSMVLFFLSLKYLKKDNFGKYFLLNLLGCFFHISSVIYILVFFVVRKKYNLIFICSIAIIGIFVFVLHVKWLKLLITPLGSLLPGRLGRLIVLYLNGNSKWGAESPLSFGFLERFGTFCLLIVFNKKLYKDKDDIIFVNFWFLYFFSNIFFGEIYIISSRISELFVFSYWFVYPRLYEKISKEKKYLYILIFLLYGILRNATNYTACFYKYENILIDNCDFNYRLSYYNKYRMRNGQEPKRFKVKR